MNFRNFWRIFDILVKDDKNEKTNPNIYIIYVIDYFIEK